MFLRWFCLLLQDETTPRHWTRRLRTLERIADRVPVTNAFPPHAPFPAHRPSARHLFCEHPSARGSTLFLPCDRLALTRALLDEACDFRALASAGLVEAVLPLHGAGDGERVTRGTLTEAWALPWKGREQRVAGAPFVSSGVCQSYLRPWAQPFGGAWGLKTLLAWAEQRVGCCFRCEVNLCHLAVV